MTDLLWDAPEPRRFRFDGSDDFLNFACKSVEDSRRCLGVRDWNVAKARAGKSCPSCGPESVLRGPLWRCDYATIIKKYKTPASAIAPTSQSL